MIKRILIGLFAMIMVMSMAGCGTSNTEDTVVEDDSQQMEGTVNDTETLDPEFKAAMDSYEEFMNEYVEFMQKYSESDDATSMLADYMDYMTKYQEVMATMDEINEDELTDAELAYYTEVSLRVSQKLMEVSQNM